MCVGHSSVLIFHPWARLQGGMARSLSGGWLLQATDFIGSWEWAGYYLMSINWWVCILPTILSSTGKERGYAESSGIGTQERSRSPVISDFGGSEAGWPPKERASGVTCWRKALGLLLSSPGFQAASTKIAAQINVFYYSLVTKLLFPSIPLARRCLLPYF